jgi:PAS domain S-box-containing protein
MPTTGPLHALLARQVRKHLPHELAERPELQELLAAVDCAYRQFEDERQLVERSQELAARELQEANSHMRAVFLAVPDAFVRIDQDGTILEVGGGETARRCVAHLHPPVGCDVLEIFPAELRASVRAAMEDVQRMDAQSSMDACIETANGLEFVEARLLPLFDGQLLLVLHDIRERKLAEEQSRRSRELLRGIFDGVVEGICQLDSQGRIAFVNRSAERLLGRTSEQLIGARFHELVHGQDGRACGSRGMPCPVEDGLLAGTTLHGEHVSIERADGTVMQADLVASPLRDGDAGLAGAVVTFRDVTERNRLRSQLAQSQKLESIGQLAAGIAHEINTPTQYIGDNTRFVRDSLDALCGVLAEVRTVLARPDDAARELDGLRARVAALDLDYLLQEIPVALDQTLEGISHVARIVRSMKEFAHPSGEDMEPSDLNKAIESTTVVARNEWKYVAELVLDLDPALPLVPCVLGSVNQVMLNLIVNASHAIQARTDHADGALGRITITTRRDGDHVQIDVRDTGTGIPESARARVFDPFFTTKPVGKGTGQGLALAHGVIVEKHGGSIAFDTENGTGTVFHVRLPLVPAGSAGAD